MACSVTTRDQARRGRLAPSLVMAAARSGPCTTYQPPADPDELPLVADDTGLPGACAIAESLTADQRARVIVEVADEREEQRIDSATALVVTWLHRDRAEPGRLRALAEAICSLEAPASAVPYEWGGGESRCMTRSACTCGAGWSLPRELVSLISYWRHADSPPPPPTRTMGDAGPDRTTDGHTVAWAPPTGAPRGLIGQRIRPEGVGAFDLHPPASPERSPCPAPVGLPRPQRADAPVGARRGRAIRPAFEAAAR